MAELLIKPSKAALPLPIATAVAVAGLAPTCCFAALRQSCLVVSLIDLLSVSVFK